jgi:hypothetical protein
MPPMLASIGLLRGSNQPVMTPYFKSVIGFDPDGIGRIYASTWIEARQEARNCIRNRPETAPLTAWRFEPVLSENPIRIGSRIVG